MFYRTYIRSGLLLFLLFFLAFSGVLYPAAAYAHAVDIVDAAPALSERLQEGPTAISLRFGEELLSPFSWIGLFDGQGQPVPDATGGVDLEDPDHMTLIVPLAAALPPDLYTVRWRIHLLDGDVVTGEYAFSVGAAFATAPLPTAVAPVAVTQAEAAAADKVPVPHAAIWLPNWLSPWLGQSQLMGMGLLALAVMAVMQLAGRFWKQV
ncbi:MAG TPA: copper resistance protein CopC [Caldilineaceae bacterium]|nr:copper resistance protein CopC [Caldilineaceae bacterium]